MSPYAIDFEGGLSDAWTTIATFVPKLLFFLIILVIGWLIAKALEKVVNGILERVGFDRAVERGGIKQALEQSKYDASDILAKLVYYFVLLFTLVLAFNVFGPNAISDLLRQIIEFLPSVFVAIIIVVVAAAIAKAVKDLISNVLGGLSYGNVLANIASVFILFLGVIAALNQVGVATTVTTPVLIMILATIGGVIVVGAGGGLIKPMQQRWEGWLSNAERESGNIREQVRASGGVKEQARQTSSGYRDSTQSTGSPSPAAETTQMDVPPESRR